MKKMQLLTTFLLCLLLLNAEAKNLQARFSYATFMAPGTGPYIETYLTVEGQSARYSANGGLFQSSVELSLVIREGSTIRHFDKYNLLGPEIKDTLNELKDFTDLHRVSLPNGSYQLELTIKDNFNPESKPYTLRQDISLAYYPNVIAFSDIELVDTYTPATTEGKLIKNGFEIVPYTDNFYGKERNSLKFYAEYYYTSAVLLETEFLLNYQVVTYETHQIIEANTRFSKQKPKEVGVILSEFDITELPSGNYNLILSIRNKENQLLAMREIFFQRSKPVAAMAESGNVNFLKLDVSNTFAGRINNRDSLAEYIRCLWPISSPNENTFALNQLELADEKMMQQFFYDFWQKRNAANPQAEWIRYKNEVEKVNASYTSGRKKGYMTERGRVYLKYGAPNQISRQYSEPATYPYEIWQYYTIGNQSNRRFVFYNPELASNDFMLLHSDVRGEIFEQQWQVILKRRTETLNDVDKTRARGSYGSQMEQIFQNPR